MNTDDMLPIVRRGAFIPDTHPTYGAAVLYQEMTDVISQVIEECVTIPRNGYWQQSIIFSVTAGRSTYRIPPRAVVGAVEKVEIANSSSADFLALDAVTENHAQYYESFGGRNDTPRYYVIRGDQIDLLPTPNSSAFQLRVTYFIKPPRMCAAQSPLVNGTGTVRGLISAVNTTTRVITVNAVPFNMLLGTPAVITSGVDKLDVVHANGSHEFALVGATQTFSGLNITVGGTDDLSLIELGDYVRVAEQSEFPPIPSEFHRMIADMESVKIMLQMNMNMKAQALAGSITGDFDRFKKLITQPRTRRQPKRVGARLMTRGTSAFNRSWR